MKQQRQYINAFAVRDDLLRVIRVNCLVIAVGETGNGKNPVDTKICEAN